MQSSLSGRRSVRLLPVVVGVLVALALPASALASSFTVRVTAKNHTPTANNSNWPIVVYITKGKQKLSGKIVHYQFLYEGQVVSTQRAGEAPNHYGDFTDGVWRDNLQWPAESAGQSLVLRVVAKTKYGTAYGDWSVVPKK